MTVREFLMFMVGVGLGLALMVQWGDRRFDDLGERMGRLEATVIPIPSPCPDCFIIEEAVLEQEVGLIQSKYVINQKGVCNGR